MIEPLIRWSGSKRTQIDNLSKYFPSKYNRYFEPFVGGGSVLYTVNPDIGFASDLCEPLIGVYNLCKYNPKYLIDSYASRWKSFQTDKNYYYTVRDQFNVDKKPEDFIFLSRTSYNGLIRFNSDGMFNAPVQACRNGLHPDRFSVIVNDWSTKIRNIEFRCCDYRDILNFVKKDDFVYLDPPYSRVGGSMYIDSVDFNDIILFLRELNDIGAKYVLSYDGKRGSDDLTLEFPDDLYEFHDYVYSGYSSFTKIATTDYKSIYDSVYTNFSKDDMIGFKYKSNKLFPSLVSK